MSFSVTITENTARFMQGVEGVFTTGDVLMVAGEAVANRIRFRFQELEATRPNKKNWPRQHFWADAYKSVQNPSRRAGAVTISINHLGVALRLFGGDTEPVTAKWLTIPATADAYGMRAREFGTLSFGFAVNEYGHFQAALIERAHSLVRFGGKRKDGTRSVTQTASVLQHVKFWLTKHTHHEPDPTVLPTEEQMAKAAVDRADFFIQRKIAETGGTAS